MFAQKRMIPHDTIERIISLTHIEEVVGDYVALRKAGTNYKGCCPFHDEKTPSFVVSPAKGIFKCFGCGKAGNAVTFLREHEKCSYYDAIRLLGNKYHVEIVETELTEEEKQRRDIRESLQIVNKYAADFFEKTMWETDEGKSVGLGYFTERGFTEEIIRKFHLGYSPQKRNAFTEAAKHAGYKLEYLTKLGLTTTNEVDKYNGRVIFPIMSVSGTVIGFGGRVLTAANAHVEGGMKYINSPESEVYTKSRTLYGISLAKTEIVRKDECILVEGYTDVISMHQAGICNVVASSGTSLTNDQIDMIRRFTENIVIIYDGDNAGIKAANRGMDMILEKDMNVYVLLIPNGDDPDTFAKTHSAEELATFIKENKTDFLTFRTRNALQGIGNDPIEKANFTSAIAMTIAKIPNAIKRSVFIKECAKILEVEEQSIKNHVNQTLGNPVRTYRTNQVQQVTQTEQAKTNTDPILYCEQNIVRLLIEYGTKQITIPNADLLINVNKSIWQKNMPNQPFPYQNYTFDGLVKDYIKKNTIDLQMGIDNQSFTLTKEKEKALFDTYYEKYDEKQEEIVNYLRDYVDAEQVANIMSDNSSNVDIQYWDKDKEKSIETKIEEQQCKDSESLANELRETLLEYIKRRFELVCKTKCEQKDLKTMMLINDFINIITTQMHHTSR